jgi:DtxR family Mn-dependent transcriptional regulator
LARDLGDPLYDPHGDPIPTAGGLLPHRTGQPLSALRASSIGRVVHLEDEPDHVYAEVLAAGIEIGTTIEVDERTAKAVRVRVDGRPVVLPPVVAANVSVESLAEVPGEPARSLAGLVVGQLATVNGLSAGCRGMQRRRLLDLGFTPGAQVSALFRSAAGDPVAYRIRDTVISLRGADAELILVAPDRQ